MRFTLLSIALTLSAAVIPVSAQATAEHQHYQLNIPRQSLDAALKDFAKQTGLQIARFSDAVDGSAMVGPVTGDITVAQALNSLLGPQGLSYKVVNDRTIAIVKPGLEQTSVGPGDADVLSVTEGVLNSGATPDPGAAKKAGWFERFRVAQNEPASPSDSSSSRDEKPSQNFSDNPDQQKLEEIVVTAQKREERLQDVPISITALSGDTLQQKNYTSLSDIAGSAPNLQFGGGASAQVFIRGVGQSDFLLTTDPGVGIYIDGVYIARQSGTPASLADIERVEVLRGPQGTLFGKNTLGGALNIITKDPNGAFDGMARVQVGSRDRRDVDGAVRFPISETLAASLSVNLQQQNGYYRNLTTHEDFSDLDRKAARGKLRWAATDALTLVLGADFERRRQNGTGTTMTVILPGTTPSVFGPFPLANFAPPVTSPVSTQYAGLWNAGVGGCPPANASTSLSCFGPQWETRGYTTNETTQEKERGQYWGTSLTASYNFDAFTLKSITAYRKFWAYYDGGADGSPLALAALPTVDRQHQISEELQLSGTSFENRLRWTAGLYYFKENSENFAGVHFLSGVPAAFPLSGIDDGTGNPVIAGPPGSGAPPVLVPTQALFVALNLDTIREQVGTSYAGYAQGTYNLTDRLSATLGARYSYEKKEFAFTQMDLNVPPAIPGVMDIPRTPLDKNWNSFTPRAGLEFRLAPDKLLYVSVARGFKSGGFNARPTSNPPRFTSYDPEYLQTYEAGYKSEWLGHRLRINADVFHSKYTNIQLQTFIFFNGDYITEVANAGDGHMNGVEAEITALPHPRLSLSAGIGYLHFDYDRVHDIVGPNTNTPPGKLLPFTPEWTVNASASAILWKSARGEIAVRGDVRYQSKTTFDIFNQGSDGGYGVLDGRFSFTSADGKWGAFVLGRNLTDKLYGPVGNFNLMGIAESRTYAAPREWGAGVQYSF